MEHSVYYRNVCYFSVFLPVPIREFKYRTFIYGKCDHLEYHYLICMTRLISRTSRLHGSDNGLLSSFDFIAVNLICDTVLNSLCQDYGLLASVLDVISA